MDPESGCSTGGSGIDRNKEHSTDSEVDTYVTASTVSTLNGEGDGVALIKAEYIDHHHKRILVEDYLPKDVVVGLKREAGEIDVIDESAAAESSTADVAPVKKQKVRGRLKQRPVQKPSPTSERLCPTIMQEVPCTYGAKCKFSHDVAAYIASKPPDLGDHCVNFDNLGKCPYGLCCRYGKSHISCDFQNMVKQGLWENMREQKTYSNLLNKSLQISLRKRAYNFQKSEKASTLSVKGEWDKLALLREEYTQCPPVDIQCVSGPTSCNAQTAESQVTRGVNLQSMDNGNVQDQRIKGTFIEVASDSESIQFRPQEKKTIDFKNKLYLAPLTTCGNLPFRRVCKTFGADITCGEMAMSTNLLQGQMSEWALIKRHSSEDLFGVQLCGSFPDSMTKAAQVLTETCDVDFIDINCGCPIDMVFKRGEGSALMGRKTKLEQVVKSMTAVMGEVPLTLKLRTAIYEGRSIAHELIPKLRDWGISLCTLHGRSREQRYMKLADWDYISQCANLASPMPLFGNGDILSYEDANLRREQTGVSGVMIARGALIKPWLFTEIKEQRHWDISSTERLDMLRQFVNGGLEHWGSDDQGVATTRKFLLEWLSFLYRYIPVGVLERVPQRINEKPPYFFGRNHLETMMASSSSADWVKLSEMLLGPVPHGYVFVPKHKANAYK